MQPSPRIALRRLGHSDLAAFQAYRSDAAVGRYQGWSAQTDEQALAFIEEMSAAALFVPGRWVQLAVAERESNALIGDIGICVSADGASAELGFTLSLPFQRRGLGTETLLEAVALVFEHSQVGQIVCIADARNTPSIRLLERAQMRRIASLDAVFRGEPCVEHTYAVFREEPGRPPRPTVERP
jgi:RimJ/RimL family protein N-acetyltransferase